MPVTRNRVCQHCNKEFSTSQYAAKFCSITCRTKARNTKTAAKRIANLPASDEWLWVARECRRAGTVEALTGVDLVELFSVYRRRFKCYGWNAERKTSKFHLCHISPARGDHTVGLLHHLNLFIGGSLPNQVHGSSSYEGAGLSIPRVSLRPKWLVDAEASDKAVLRKVQSFLGNKLVEYAKVNPIRKSQRFGLARKIYNEHPSCDVSLDDLEKMGMQALRKLKAELEEQELYTLKLTPKRSLVVYLQELERFSQQITDDTRRGDYAFMADAVRCVILWLMNQPNQDGFDSVGGPVYDCRFVPVQLRADADGSDLRDFAAFQAFSVLQGAKLDKQLITNTLRKYLKVVTLDHYDSRTSHADNWLESAYWITEAIDVFSAQTELNKQALHTLGLVDAEFMYWWLESKKESLEIAAFYEEVSFTQCKGEWDYPDHCYQVEDDYIPKPPIQPWFDPNYLPF